jgi:LPS-assembly protein
MLLNNVRKNFLTILLLVVSDIVYCVGEVSSNKPMEYIADKGKLVAEGDARVEAGNFTIQADEITFQKEQSMAIASGNVKIDNEKIYVVADRVSYDMNSNLVHANNSKAKIHDYYFHIENIDLDTANDVQTGINAEVFHSTTDRMCAPSISVRSFEKINEQSIKTRNAKFKIGPATIFYLPSVEIDLSSRSFYLEQNYGLNHSNGAYLQNDFYFGVNKRFKLGGLLDFYTKRGILVGPALKIDTRSEKNQISSEAKFGFIRDGINEKQRGLDINNDPIPSNRYFLEFTHRQHYGDQIDIIARIASLSDSEVERDFRKAWYDHNQQPESFVEMSYRGQNYIISAFGQFEPNTFYNTTQQQPELHIAYLPTKLLNTKLIHNADLGIVRLSNRNKNLYGVTNISRADIYYGISLPLGYKNFFTIKPIFGTRTLVYDRNIDGETYGKSLVQGGFDISTKFTGRSDYTNETFGIKGLKHVINPTIQYRVIPSGNESTKIPWRIF